MGAKCIGLQDLRAQVHKCNTSICIYIEFWIFTAMHFNFISVGKRIRLAFPRS